jgi:hypothetical protein
MNYFLPKMNDSINFPLEIQSMVYSPKENGTAGNLEQCFAWLLPLQL